LLRKETRNHIIKQIGCSAFEVASIVIWY